jgi:pyruvate/2-oxoglutarate dehydrogenase complex dihydrolipoamide acyltransferase (E2) component
MYLKLMLPSVDPLMRGGTIVRWHKAEGDAIDYGDDLVDVEIELTMSMLDGGTLEEGIRLLKDGAQRAEVERFTNQRGLQLTARVTASDTGTLRSITAVLGEHVAVGGLLAVLVVGDGEAPLPGPAELADASEFRTVSNLVE